MENAIRFYPQDAGSKQTVAERVIRILRKQSPLNLMEIHKMVARENSRKVSYQATHKALKKLVENKVLKKNGLKYELSIVWLKQLERFLQVATTKRKLL